MSALSQFASGEVAFFDHLSPSSRTALARAAELARRSRQDKVHMEHLVTGLWLKDDGPARRLFAGHGIHSAGTW